MVNSDGSAAQTEVQRRMREKRFEIISTLILSMAALATAWSGYQASLWDGIQSSDYSQAAALRTNAAQKLNESQQYRLADLSVFQGFVGAKATGDERLATFYLERFRPELKVAYDAWIVLDPLNDPAAPSSPFVMPEYQPLVDQQASDLTASAAAKFAEGEVANTFSDQFTLATVLFASALFFAAISERFEFVAARVTLLVLASLGLIGGLGVSFTQPVAGP